MRTTVKLLVLVGGLGFGAGSAHAQVIVGNSPAAPTSVPGYEAGAAELRNGDAFDRDAARARDDAVAKQRERDKAMARSSRSRPATPAEVTAGSEVRDPKGEVIGTIESVSMAAAVVNSPGGKVEVPIEAFGINAKGLLVGMAKADFDAAVAAANKPAG